MGFCRGLDGCIRQWYEPTMMFREISQETSFGVYATVLETVNSYYEKYEVNESINVN